MKITYYGHSCFGINIAGRNLLFDPFVTQNELAKEIDLNQIAADYILLSHGHFDHVADVMEIEKKTGATVVSNFEITSWFQSKGVRKIHPMNQGGQWKFDFGKVRYTAAVHSSSMPDGTYGGNPGGFVVESEAGAFYYSGDTALFSDMKLIPTSGYNLKAAFLPIGDNFTMGIDDAIKASDFIQCNRIIGMHYDTFGFIKINHEEAVEKFKQKGKELTLMKIGETINL